MLFNLLKRKNKFDPKDGIRDERKKLPSKGPYFKNSFSEYKCIYLTSHRYYGNGKDLYFAYKDEEPYILIVSESVSVACTWVPIEFALKYALDPEERYVSYRLALVLASMRGLIEPIDFENKFKQDYLGNTEQ